ncbi:MAG TPA: hypothetical protein VF463_19930 [Sphingobium sp.]
MFGLFRPKAPTISMEAHDQKCEWYEGQVASLKTAVNREQAAARYHSKASLQLFEEKKALAAELATFRAARAKQLANLTAANERRKAAKKTAELPDGLVMKEGRPHFDCVSCGKPTEWEGDVADFVDGMSEKRCGGSPRCIP